MIAVLTHAGAMPLSPRRLRSMLKRCRGDERVQVLLLQSANTLWCLQEEEGLAPDEAIKDVALLFLEGIQADSPRLQEAAASGLHSLARSAAGHQGVVDAVGAERQMVSLASYFPILGP